MMEPDDIGYVGSIESNMAENTKQRILRRLIKIIELLEEQNDILLFDSEGCCSECDGNCAKDAEHYVTDSVDDEGR